MSKRPIVEWRDLVVLGGRQDDDPPAEDVTCEGCAHENEKSCLQFAASENESPCDLALPPSGFLALRVLWRHLDTRHRNPLLPMEVPIMARMSSLNKPFWRIRITTIGERWDDSFVLGHGELCDCCEALAVLIKEEADRVRKEKK